MTPPAAAAATAARMPMAFRVMFRAAPALVALAAGAHLYWYSEYDKRDLDELEIGQAHRVLERLDGGSLAKSEKDDGLPIQEGTSASASTSTNSGVILQKHLANLDSSGATLICSVLTPKEAAVWDKTVSTQLQKDGACVVPMGGAVGRTHCHLAKRDRRGKGDGLYEALAQVSNHKSATNKGGVTLSDVARAYFRSHDIEEGRYTCAQMQLLDAAPRSSNQIWHRDNAQPGLTALIALRDVGSNGPTELLLRSHHSPSNVLLRNSIGKNEEQRTTTTPELFPRILLASIQSGDAILYDARVLHRGRGYGNHEDSSIHENSKNTNTTSSICEHHSTKKTNEHRPVLVIRWDANVTPAPGTGIIGTQVAALEGACLARAATILGWFS